MKKILTLTLLIFIFSCSSNSTNNYPPIRFKDKSSISFDVARIEVVDNFVPSFAQPNIEHLFPYAPAMVIKDWAQDRLYAKGKDKVLRVVIADASVVEKKLPKTPGLKGQFTVDQGELYEARYDVRLEIMDTDPVFPIAEMRITVNRSESLVENATIAERERLFYEIGKGLAEDFNREFDMNYNTYFSKYITW